MVDVEMLHNMKRAINGWTHDGIVRLERYQNLEDFLDHMATAKGYLDALENAGKQYHSDKRKQREERVE